MANEFDPYREALVVEQLTNWPESCDNWEPTAKSRIEQLLHAAPQEATELTYVRQHSGFRREITVSEADLQRLGVAV